MASQGPNSAGTISVVTRSGYTVASNWINSSNAASSNNSYTYCALEGNIGYSQYLKVENFGFSIPSGSTIDGIEVKIERYASYNTGSAYVKDSQLKLYKNGTLSGNDLANTTNTWSTSESIVTYGGSSNLWGETWTVSDINASNFGVGYSVFIASVAKVNTFAYVDHVTVTIYYTEGGGGGGTSTATLFIGD